MKQLTDEMIADSLQGSGIFLMVIGIVLLALAVVVLIFNIKRSKKRTAVTPQYTKPQDPEFPANKKTFHFSSFLLSFVCVMLFAFGLVAAIDGIRNMNASRRFVVTIETLESKDTETKRIHRQKKTDRIETYYYLTFSETGTYSTTQSKFSKVYEGQSLILVTSSGKLMKIYDTAEYEYVGS